MHIDRLVKNKDQRVSSSSSAAQLALTTMPFTAEDMCTIMNAWRHNVDSWMRQDTLERYRYGKNRQQLCKSAFNAYLQHLSGCKFLLRRLIALPIVSALGSAAQPASRDHMVKTFLELSQEWNTHKESDDHKAAIEKSRGTNGHRLSVQVGNLHEVYRKAAMHSQMVADGTIAFSALSDKDQRDVEHFDCRTGFVKELDYLLTQQLDQARPYPGAGVVVRAPS